ncbi:MAG: alanine dehydrogenase [Bacteroidetes bacterium HGW-Bacteroidetes-21]|jgi:alanine dehydrogenase|nr:MAG: alanine dehydrogenase [Bacteroidetes bacterium HGW-Bacteroidetes-21]
MVNQSKSERKPVFSKTSLMPQEEKLAVKRSGKTFTIGIPREEDKNENRIPLTPMTVEMLVREGHEIIIQSNAGMKANFQDLSFSEAGARMVDNKEEVFSADIVLKVSPPTDLEIGLMKDRALLISILNAPTQNPGFFRKQSDKRITSLAYEYIKDESDCFPIVRSMSEIAGNTAVLIAAEYLSNVHEGKGEMLGGITGVNPSEVIILGAGTAGEFAARTALGLGAIVKIFDSSTYKLKRLQNNLGQRVFTSMIIAEVLSNALKTADVVIGAMRRRTAEPIYVITEDMVGKMKKGSVIIDISIDQGGCIETSRLTTHAHPVFVKNGVVHYCVPNIPSRVARTASYAFSNIFAPMIREISYAGGVRQLMRDKPAIRNGVYMFEGILTNQQLGNMFSLPSQDINLLMAAF